MAISCLSENPKLKTEMAKDKVDRFENPLLSNHMK
jgi:hypothetical protein